MLTRVYKVVDPALAIDFEDVDRRGLQTETDVDAALDLDYQFVVGVQPMQARTPVSATLAFAGIALGILCHFDIVVNGPVLAGILDGSITTWQHKAILALNPQGLQHRSHGPLLDAETPIQLLQGPVAGSRELDALMRTYAQEYTGAAIKVPTSLPPSPSLTPSWAHWG